MRIVVPFAVTPALLTSNIAESAPAAWDAGATYAAGQQASVTSGTVSLVYQSLAGSNTGNAPVSSPSWWAYVSTTYAEYSAAAEYGLGDIVINATGVGPTHHAYESLQAANTGRALSDASWWLDLGATNRLAMFDTSNGTLTQSSYNIDFTVNADGSLVNGIMLCGLTAESVRIVMTSAAYGGVYDETFSLQSEGGVTSWYDYFTERIHYSPDFLAVDLPSYTDCAIRVVISSASGVVSCGTCVLGRLRDLGGTVYGARTGIQDFSRKEADDLGNYTLVERSYSKRGTFKVVVDNNQIDAFQQQLADLRATPTAWIGADDYASTWIFGFARDWANVIEMPTRSFLSIEIEGLT